MEMESSVAEDNRLDLESTMDLDCDHRRYLMMVFLQTSSASAKVSALWRPSSCRWLVVYRVILAASVKRESFGFDDAPYPG